MKSLSEQFETYGAYHLDQRNCTTHYIGVPLIMFGILVLLAMVRLPIAGISLALLALIAVSVYYFMLDWRAGAAMLILDVALWWLAESVAAMPMSRALAIGIGTFVVGWIFQSVGHVYEGRKPAFFDDIRQLFVGPVFLVTKLMMQSGGLSDIRAKVNYFEQIRRR